MLPNRFRNTSRLVMLLGGLSVVAACLLVRYYWGAESASADPPPRPVDAAAPSKPSQPKVVAAINGRRITREELGRECLRHYGKQVLGSLVNKLLITQECKRRSIVVTQGEVDAEIERMARRFGLPKDQWLKMLKKERGINPAQYAGDIIWPTLALRHLAGDRLKVTQEEMVKAYETKYGSAVRARLIACKGLAKAREAHARAVANPENFGNVAKEYSEDASASLKGQIQPIRKHGYYRQIEQAAFTMQDGQISQVIPAGGQYVILKREGLLPGAKAVNFEQVAPQLREIIRDRKLRSVANDVFHRLQKASKVENVLNDPVKSRAMPGVAAVVNGHRITISELAEQCIQRHGLEVLEGTINRKLIEMECQKRNVKITAAEIDGEIVRAASVAVKPTPDGSPDVEKWLNLVTERQGISQQVYRRDSVWPSVALKKLVGERVEVTGEDLRKGYEANYGPRVRCLAIVMNNLRRAQHVWDMARENPTAEYFGELAAQYSIESSSRALRGEVPPIKRHGGQPLLEKEAFLLKPGELSGVVQVGERFVILFCLGRTKPTGVSFEQVRALIYEDIYEKKQRLTMAEYFEHLQDTAMIDNYLAGTTRRPKKPAGPKPAPNMPTLRQVPGQR